MSLALVLLLGGLPAAAAEGGALLILQMDGGAAVSGGAELSAPAPYYAANGAQMVPLAFTAGQLGFTVSGDGCTVTSADGTSLTYAPGSWVCRGGTKTVPLSSPAARKDGVLYVPLASLTVLGVYVHSFGYYDGAFLAVSVSPLTAGDSSGAPNAAYDPAAPDAALAACQAQALRLLGPNQGMMQKNTVVLRQGSRFAAVSGTGKELCGPDGTTAPFLTEDGYLMVPVEFLAKAFGGTCTAGPDGSSTVVCNGHTAVFPAANGYLTADGVKKQHPWFGGCRRNGVCYCSAYAFTAALGLYGYTDGATDGIAVSRCDLSRRPELKALAWKQAGGLTLLRDEKAKGYLALTFDDGPSGAITGRLLDGLKARGVHATFFLCNYRIKIYPRLMSRYLDEGNELGNHSANHTTLTRCGASALASELDSTNASIRAKTGVNPVLMRPPGGAYNKTVLAAAAKRGMSCVLWSVDPQDWKYRNKQKVVSSILSQAKDGDIILMHDTYNTSVDAALSIIDTLRARGYRFVTVSELARIKGVGLRPGAVYFQIRG